MYGIILMKKKSTTFQSMVVDDMQERAYDRFIA